MEPHLHNINWKDSRLVGTKIEDILTKIRNEIYRQEFIPIYCTCTYIYIKEVHRYMPA